MYSQTYTRSMQYIQRFYNVKLTVKYELHVPTVSQNVCP